MATPSPPRSVAPRPARVRASAAPPAQRRSTRSRHADLRTVPLSYAPGPPPATEDGTRMFWAAMSGEWQAFKAPCPDCLQLEPIVYPEAVCQRCAAAQRLSDDQEALRYQQQSGLTRTLDNVRW